MIEEDNLRTASLYINNQLLSRGLLRDGQSIDFANPFDGDDDDDVGYTMGRIMSVVNDLILRRDRDAEHRESLSTAMRALRAENLKNTNDITRLAEKHLEAKRKLEIAEATEASLKSQLKSAESAARGLKEEAARTKALVAQTRSACATEVRRRDRQLDTLKKQLGEAGRARGSRGNPAVTTITVVGDIGEDKSSSFRAKNSIDSDSSLRQETNAFLAGLAQNLSEENEAVVGAMKHTLQRLRHLSGWGNHERGDPQVIREQGWEEMAAELDSVIDHIGTILTNPSFVPIEEVEVREAEIARLKKGWVRMENRWEEAVHLIDGWRKRMAANGRPICDEELKMGLRLSPVRIKDVEETRQSRSIRLSAVTEEPEEDEEVYESPSRRTSNDNNYDQNESDIDSSFDDNVDVDELDVEEPNVEILNQSVGGPLPSYFRDSSPSPLPRAAQQEPLQDSSNAGNRGNLRVSKFRRKQEDPAAVEEGTPEFAISSRPPQPPPHRVGITPRPSRSNMQAGSQLSERGPSVSDAIPDEAPRVRSPEKPRQVDFEPSTASSSSLRHKHSSSEKLAPVEPESRRSSPQRSQQGLERANGESENPPDSPTKALRRVQSRLPLPRNGDSGAPQSPLTMAIIAAKLAASEREADAARVRAKLKAARGARGVKKPVMSEPQRERRPEKRSEKKHASKSRPEPRPEPRTEPTSQPKSEPQRPEPEPEPQLDPDFERSYADPDMDNNGMEDVDPVKHDPTPPDSAHKPEKRKRDKKTSRAASRRRSTLSPWELQSLITGEIQ